MKKLVAKVELYDEKAKKKAMKIVSGLSGVESIQIELKDKKLTVVGDMDPVSVVNKLRKCFHAEIVSVGPAKEEKKKEEPKKAEEEKKKEEPKKAEEEKKKKAEEEKKKKESAKKEERKKAEEKKRAEGKIRSLLKLFY